jgi:copper chaperone
LIQIKMHKTDTEQYQSSDNFIHGVHMKHAMTVENLKCDGCGHTITNELSKIDGVKQIVINPTSKIVSFEADDAGFLRAKQRLHELGYPEAGSVHGIDSLVSTAKSYASCAIGRLDK